MSLNEPTRLVNNSSDQRKTLVILIVSTLVYFPFIFLGYGTDGDTYRVIETGSRLITEQVYVPTRPPGYFLYSLITGILDLIGGSVLTNFGSLIMGISIIYLFIQICDLLDVPHKHILSIGLMIHPVFLINATSTMDYLWALFFLLLGYYKILEGDVLISGISFGVAVGFRATSAFFVIALFLSALMISETKSREYLFSMVIGGVIGVLWYIPVLVYADFNILYLHPSLEPGTPASNNWSLFETIARFGYKQIFFWGLPTTILGVASTPYLFAGIKKGLETHKQSIIQPIFIILSTEVIYLRAPLEPAYLLPMLPFILIIVGTIFNKKSIIVFIFLILSFNFISVDFICFGSYGSPLADMNVGIYIDPGLTVYDTKLRFNNETREKLNYFGACGKRIIQIL